MKHLLDNIAWHALSGPHAKYAAGTVDARRYASGFSPIVGFANTEHPNFDALARFCGPGEHFYCGGWSGRAPAEWHIDVDSIAQRFGRGSWTARFRRTLSRSNAERRGLRERPFKWKFA